MIDRNVRPRPGRRLAWAALVCLVPAFAGCEIHTGQFVRYHRDGVDLAKPPGSPEPPPIRAAKRNDLVAGVKKFKLAATSQPDEEKEAGDPKDVGRDFVEALQDAKIFKEVHYPLRDESIDVEIEPIVAFGLKKNGFTNFVKLFPGLVFPWIKGFGFDYDHTYVLELRVRDAQRPDVVCDAFRKELALTADRHPSIFWFAGLHASLFVLLILESASTDEPVLKILIQKNAQSVQEEALKWLVAEFAPTARTCPLHPDVGSAGKFCPVCGTNLRYPILNRVNGKAVAPSKATPPPPSGPGPGTGPGTVPRAPTSTAVPAGGGGR